MKTVVIYRPNSEHGSKIESFLRDFRRFHPELSVEVLNIDSRDGTAMATLYDVIAYPAIMVLQNDGQMEKYWQGDNLPLMAEVVSYARL